MTLVADERFQYEQITNIEYEKQKSNSLFQ